MGLCERASRSELGHCLLGLKLSSSCALKDSLELVQLEQTLSITTSVLVVVLTQIVSDLTTGDRRLAEAAVLSKPGVTVNANLTAVQLGVLQVEGRLERRLVIIEVNEAETARGFCDAVETHDDSAHEPYLGEVLIDL